jgi:hypothetical protein
LAVTLKTAGRAITFAVASAVGIFILLYVAAIVASVRLFLWIFDKLFPPRRSPQQDTGD